MNVVVRKTIGQYVYQAIVALLVVVALLSLVWSGFQSWRARSASARADHNAAAAITAQANATSADTGAANATTTRTNIDAGTLTVRVETEQSAGRIETYANRPVPAADRAPVDPDVVRELEEAAHRVRAASDRLQRKDAR